MGGVGVSAILYVGSRSVLVLSLSLSPIHHLFFDRLTFVRHSFLSALPAGTNFGLQRSRAFVAVAFTCMALWPLAAAIITAHFGPQGER